MNLATPNNQGDDTLLLKDSPKMTNFNIHNVTTNPNLKIRTNMHKSADPFNNRRLKLINPKMRRKRKGCLKEVDMMVQNQKRLIDLPSLMYQNKEN